MGEILEGVNIAAMFGIDMAETTVAGPVAATKAFCVPCNGSGKYRNRAGRIIGNCFACEATGIAKLAAADECPKCFGSGQWRPGYPCFACKGKGKPEAPKEDVSIDVSRIEESFAAARNNGVLKPKLRLDTFLFSRAPDGGRNAGSLYVKEGELYLGKISGGRFFPTSECDDETRNRIVAVAASPAEAARAYGNKTGICSCCGRTLSNGESIELGIGPICRDNFGLG